MPNEPEADPSIETENSTTGTTPPPETDAATEPADAARLEAVCEPGGILISGTTYDHIRGKIKVAFDDLGAQSLKNIAEPVRTYRLRLSRAGDLTPRRSYEAKAEVADQNGRELGYAALSILSGIGYSPGL